MQNDVSLGEVIEVIRNGTSENQIDVKTEYPVTRIETISYGKVDYESVKYLAKEPFKFKLEQGDTLYSNINSVKHIGKVAYYNGFPPLYHGMNLLLIRANKSKIHPKYLYYQLASDKGKRHAENECKSAINQASLSQPDIKRFKFFLPSLPTQRKIARILSTIDGQIEKTEAIIAKYQAVKQGMLQDLFTRGIDIRIGQLRPHYEDAPDLYQDSPLGMIPKDWVVKKLKDITDYVDYRGKTPTKSENGIFLVTAKNVKQGYIDYEISREYVPEETFAAVMSRGVAEIGDVLITTEAPMGNVAQVDKPNIALAQRVIKYRGKLGIMKNDFLRLVLMSQTFQDALIADSSGSTVTGIKGSRLHKMRIIIPDITEQVYIQSVAESQERKLEGERLSLRKLHLLKQGLMQDLLSGKVTVMA